MKNFLTCLFIGAIFASCSTDDNTEKELSINDIANFTASVKILEESVSASESTPLVFEKHEILKIENETYLRSYGNDYVTTTMLQEKGDGTLRMLGVSCTSKQCATTSGCIPNSAGTGCTPCGGGLGDCVKTVSTNNQIE